MAKSPRSPLYCSFCGLSDAEVTDLIAGPSVFICNDCVELCAEIVLEAQERRRIAELVSAGEHEYLSWFGPQLPWPSVPVVKIGKF